MSYAQENLVGRFLSWERVEARREKYPSLGRCFSTQLLKKASPPYFCHPMAWRLGAWHDEADLAYLDRLFATGANTPGWLSASKSLRGSCDFAEFWSLVWELQVAEMFRSRGAPVAWMRSGPDLMVTVSEETFFVECTALRGPFAMLEFIEEVLHHIDPSFCVEWAKYLEVIVPEDNERTGFLDELLAPFVDSDWVKAQQAAARKAYAIHLPVPASAKNLYLTLETDQESSQCVPMPLRHGDPDTYLKSAVADAVKKKREENSLKASRPNLVAINLLLGNQFEQAVSFLQARGMPVPTPDFGEEFDAVLLASLGIDGRFACRKLWCKSTTHPARRLLGVDYE
jgi:hypothetical protein